MTNITFFFLLIPFLALALLIVNFIFASHNPYQEKNSTFECGFHSFLGQNRMQFNISFYIFGLLFLLFDLEILLIYPYPVSAQFNSLYGLAIMLIFFLILTLGFTFELGKNALKIDSRQYDNKSIIYKLNDNNNNKLLNSGLLNKPTSLFNKKKELLMNILSGFIVLIFFSFVLKHIVFSFDGLIYSILSGIFGLTALILKTIIKPCLMGNTEIFNEMMQNKKKFFCGILIKFISIIVFTYIVLFILAYFDFSAEFKLIFFGVFMCDDCVTNNLVNIVHRIDSVLKDPNSKLRVALGYSKIFDQRLSIVKGLHYAAWQVPDVNTPEARRYIADCRESQKLMQEVLNVEFDKVSKLKGALKKSTENAITRFESIPSNTPAKRYYLAKLNEQLAEIQSLGDDLENKNIRSRP